MVHRVIKAKTVERNIIISQTKDEIDTTQGYGHELARQIILRSINLKTALMFHISIITFTYLSCHF